MSEKELKAFVSCVISEKLRSKNFDLNSFKKLSWSMSEEYADASGLEHLGRGTARTVYLLSSGKCLKIATNNAGLGQNEAEIDVFTNPNTKEVVAKIFDYHPKMFWLISELVKPLTNIDEFKNLTGMNISTASMLISFLGHHGKEESEKLLNYKKLNPEQQKFLWEVSSLVTHSEILEGDLRKETSWGTTASGRLVVLDYGFTQKIRDKFYSS